MGATTKAELEATVKRLQESLDRARAKTVFGLWGEAVTTAEAIAGCAPLADIVLSNATSAKVGPRFVLDTPIAVDVPGRGRLPTRRIKERRIESAAVSGSQPAA